jgi:broad specificity phosphatase PhoE
MSVVAQRRCNLTAKSAKYAKKSSKRCKASPVTGDPRKLILVRHSVPAIVPGVPAREWMLSDHGRQRCHALAAMLAEHTPDIVVSSLEPKAVETGQIVASLLGKPFATAPGLHEHKRRGVEFSTREEFEARMAVLFAHPTELVMGSETAEQAGHRLAQAIAHVLDRYPGDNVAVVTHGTVMSLYVAQVAGVEPFSFWRRLGLPSFAVLRMGSSAVLARPAMELLAVIESVVADQSIR